MTSDSKWVTVPAEPTPEMVEAGDVANPTAWNEDTDPGFGCDVAFEVYRAMLSAAPPAPGAEVVAWSDDAVAEAIWQAEWKRAGNKGVRRSAWNDQAEDTHERYRFLARAIMERFAPPTAEEITRRASPWQPIETAPKDGTAVLLAAGDEVTAGWWNREFDCNWSDEASDMLYEGAWTNGQVASWGYEEVRRLEPSHWMPLPSPPADGGGHGG